MGKATNVEETEVWKAARVLVQEIYSLSSSRPFSQDFGLRDQIRRASVSVMSNIAEGLESDGKRNMARYLCLAKASSAEVRSQLVVALDHDYITKVQFRQAFDRSKSITRQLTGFVKYLRSK